MNDKMKNLTVRTLSGIVFLLIVVGAALWAKVGFGILLGLVMVGSIVEFYQLCRAKGYAPLRGIGVGTAVAIFGLSLIVFMNYGAEVDAQMGRLALGILLFLLLIVPTAFVCELWHNSPTPIANVATTFAGVIYIALPLSLMLFIPLLIGNGEWKPWTALCYFAIIWVNDIFAYLVGVGVGRRRMCKRISPKKSWEGFFGGVVAAIGAGILCGHLLGENLLLWGGLAAVVAVTGVAGDFVESLFKRAAGVKDSGNIMPGHGGVLDRFDALIISAPYAFAYLLIVGNL
ncbi:MAG: phosphatidate cytidylyltransferase [Alistipes sp.]|nr:phosphatidate cytidylyltransferase [Alistipes sp.]